MAENRLRVLLTDIAKDYGYSDKNIELKSTVTDDSNFTSDLFVASISDPSKDTIHLFSKVCKIGEELRSCFAEPRILNNEFNFYQILMKVYDKMQDEHGVTDNHRLKIPKYYKSSSKYLEEVLVLEDLGVKGFVAHDRFDTVDLEYALSAIGDLAKFHALSMAYYHEAPDEFEANVKYFPLLFGENENLRDIVYTRMVNISLESINEENKERVKKFFETDQYLSLLRFYKSNSIKVLVHGDFRKGNLLHKRNEGGNLEIIILDFQMMCCGNPVSDLMYFIYTGTDGQFRKLHLTNLVEYYYTELSSALRRLHVDIDDVYPRVNFEADLEATAMFGLFIGMVYLSRMTAAGENISDLSDGIDIEGYTVKPSGLFAPRLNDIIDEYVSKDLL